MIKIDKESKLLNLFIPLLLFLVAFCWKLFFINQRDLCLDEPFSVFNAQKSLAEIMKIPAQGEPNPPLFMILLHFWMKLVGLETGAIRILPLIFNAVTVVFLYLAGKRFFSLWTGLVASGLFLFSTYHFYHGIEARTYSFFSMATAASLYFYFLYAGNTKNYKALTGLILSNILLVYSHYFGWFVIFSQFLTSIFYIRSFRSFFRLMIPFLGTAAGFIPMVPVIIRQFNKSTRIGTWLNPPNGTDFLEQIQYFLNHKEVYWLVLYIFSAGAVFTLIMVALKKWKGLNIGVPVLLIWWFVPYCIMFLISSKIPMFNSKYILFNTIGMYLFIGAMINFLFQKHKYIEPLVGLVLIVYMYLHLKILPDYFAYREVRNSVEFVKSHENDKSIVLIYPVWADFAFTYYYDRSIFQNHQNFQETMVRKDLYRVWGLSNVQTVIRANPKRRVIYYQDGKNYNEGEDVFGYLDTAFVRVDLQVFPQTFKVGVYDPKPME
ncbi:MAG: glycosyltransferase family 39 protein [Bacteroidales bacterium]|nr:glycosyltransferase family 39 protein [Bacteroidales bacterium]